MSHTILEATTDAATSEEFIISDKAQQAGGFTGGHGTAQVSADALAGSEEAHLEILSGDTWQDVQDPDGNVPTLGVGGAAGATVFTVNAPGTYRVQKDATVSACAIFLHTHDNP